MKVIASNLTADEAFIIEATLLWKLGKWMDNKISGHYKNYFRPWNTLHLELPKFDFQKNVHYYNIDEGETRNWDDYTKYGFISAGQGTIWRKHMLGFKPGDIFFAYLKKHGYVGVGIVLESAKMAKEVKFGKRCLLDLKLKGGMNRNADNKELSEYVAKVKWLKTLKREQAIWPKSPKLFSAELARASLANQPETIKYLEKKFKINLKDFLL